MITKDWITIYLLRRCIFSHAWLSCLVFFPFNLLQWGFVRILKGPEAGGYTHEYFVRGQVDLCKKMKRIKVKGSPEKRLKPIRCPKTTGIPDVPQKTTLPSNKNNKNETYHHLVQQRNSGARFLSTSSFSTSHHDIFGGERFFSSSSAPNYHDDRRLQHDRQSGTTSLVSSSIDPLPLDSSIHSSTSSMLFDSNDFKNICWDLLSK
jgi:hypothetical protein